MFILIMIWSAELLVIWWVSFNKYNIFYASTQAADNPTVHEIRDVCQSQGLNCEIEVMLSFWVSTKVWSGLEAALQSFIDLVCLVSWSEIFGASDLHLVNLIFFSQNKYYPRDSAKDAMCRGRVRVQLKNSDSSFVNEKFQSSKVDTCYSV